MEKHDWPAVMEALEDMKFETEQNEPHAVNLIHALEEVIASMPDEAFQ